MEFFKDINPNMNMKQGKLPPAPPKIQPTMKNKFDDSDDLCECFNKYTYLRLRNGQSFWIWLIAIYDTYIICYRWNGQRWVSAQVSKHQIADCDC